MSKALAVMIPLLFLSLPPISASAAPAMDGEGAMSVLPTSAPYGSTGNTFTFTFTANIGDFGPGSQVTLTIPPGWTPPTVDAGAGHVTVESGTCAWLGSPPFEVAGSTIKVDLSSCTSGEFFTVTYTGVTVPAVAGSPYTFATQTDIGPGGAGLRDINAGSPTVAVNPAALTVAGLTADSRTYDGTTDATITIGTPTLVGVIGADTVTLVTGGASAAFSDRNAGATKSVGITGLTLAGVDAGNYTLAQPIRAANIAKRPITVTAATETKLYDGTTGANGVPNLSGDTPLAPGDSAPAWTQTFDTRNAGTGKSLIPTGAVGDGNGGLNYSYTYVPNATGVITAKPITVGAVSDSKVYDGTTGSSGVPTLSPGTPLAPGDAEPAWTQAFDTKDVGTGKTISPAGTVSDGNGGLNYTVTFTTDTTGVITARPITVTADAKAKAAGAADPALTYGVNPALFGTDSFSGALARGPGESAGLYAITQGTLTAGGNYAITYVGASLTINPAISGNAGIDGVTLSYDDGGPWTALSGTDGSYTLIVSYGWSGTVTPSLNGYTFTPPSIDYVNVTSNLAGQDYVADKIFLAFTSVGKDDGWLLESSEFGNTGGSFNATAKTFTLGDDAFNRQYRAILSFDTSGLPDNAVVTKVTLKIKKLGQAGTNPLTTHGAILVDVRKGTFGKKPLQSADFQAAASKVNIGLIKNKPIGGWFGTVLLKSAASFINKVGLTQLRLHFTNDDNNDNGADFLTFYSGNAAPAMRPVLLVEYSVP